MVLSDIGKIYMDMRGINPNYDNINNFPRSVDTYIGPLNVLVFTKTPVAFPGGMQTVFVVVRDSALQGIADANITINLIYPDGSEQNLPPASSDQNGIYEVTFLVPADLPAEQIVQVHANANSKGNSGAGQSWFRVRP